MRRFCRRRLQDDPINVLGGSCNEGWPRSCLFCPGGSRPLGAPNSLCSWLPITWRLCAHRPCNFMPKVLQKLIRYSACWVAQAAHPAFSTRCVQVTQEVLRYDMEDAWRLQQGSLGCTVDGARLFAEPRKAGVFMFGERKRSLW